MNKAHHLVKLRTDTVNNLKILKSEMGQGCLDGLINHMIRVTKAYRLCLKETGWNFKR